MARTSRNCIAFVGAVLAMAPIGLLSQPIYRCGSNYSQTPCANGIVVRADDLRTPDQKAQTDAATLQAARLAAHMERERLASEHRSTHASNRPAKGKPAHQPSATLQAANRPGSPEAVSKAPPQANTKTSGAAKSRPQPPAPDPFVAMARQDVKKKNPAAAPTRD